MSEAYSNISVVRQQLVSVGESRGCTLMVRDAHHGSLSGVLYGYARLPTLPVVRMGINHFNTSHASTLKGLQYQFQSRSVSCSRLLILQVLLPQYSPSFLALLGG